MLRVVVIVPLTRLASFVLFAAFLPVWVHTSGHGQQLYLVYFLNASILTGQTPRRVEGIRPRLQLGPAADVGDKLKRGGFWRRCRRPVVV